jgi:hypothetical protein
MLKTFIEKLFITNRIKNEYKFCLNFAFEIL